MWFIYLFNFLISSVKRFNFSSILFSWFLRFLFERKKKTTMIMANAKKTKFISWNIMSPTFIDELYIIIEHSKI
jgi:hypothetical protein